MNNKSGFKKFIADNWLVLLIALQPLLDALAFWTQNSAGTAAGVLRLLIMLALPLYLLFTLKKKKGFIISMAAIALFGILHMLNGFRVGYISVFYDLAYYARVIQMPVFVICFTYLIRDEKTKKQAIKGLIIAGLILAATILTALATGTWNSTYGGGIGLSGWVTDDNRTANSIIMVSLAVFAMSIAAVSKSKLSQIIIPCVLCFFLIANGTKACYMGLFAMLLGYAFFMLLNRLVNKEKLRAVLLVTLAVLTVVSVLVYPVSPRSRVDQSQAKTVSESQLRFERKLEELGYDIYSMSLEEKISDPVLFELFYDYYVSMLGTLPDVYERFGMERVFRRYDMTVSAETLINTRLLKINYASMIFEDSDLLTKLLGIEATETVKNGMYDLENDYHAIFYYYGYIGFALLLLFILYFVFLIIRRLIADFKGSFTVENFTLLLCLMLQLGLAQFSGALLRRPNVSVYLAVVMGLIYYKTRVLPPEGKEAEI